jgi:hypothetical protein
VASSASDDADFRAYVASRQRALRGTAFFMCGDWHNADDLVQTTLTELYVAWRQVTSKDGPDAYAVASSRTRSSMLADGRGGARSAPRRSPITRTSASAASSDNWLDLAAGQSWTGGYLKSDPSGQAVGFDVAAVNGTARTAATAAVWVLSGTTVNDYTRSVLLVRTGSSTWAAHPARFTGCRAG